VHATCSSFSTRMEESSLDELELIRHDHQVELERIEALLVHESLEQGAVAAAQPNSLKRAWLAGLRAGLRGGEVAGAAHADRCWAEARVALSHHDPGAVQTCDALH
jgi:hypothetical protein